MPLKHNQNRIRNLSTRWLPLFKGVVFALYTVFCGAIVYSFLTRGGNHAVSLVLGLAQSVLYIYFFYKLMRLTSKIYRVEFDDDFLYVLQKNQDLIIPLENIESVEIATLGGVYKVNLYHPEQLGDHFYFKLSLWYPLNHPSKDDLVNLLRSKIHKRKRSPQEIATNALTS